MEKLGAFLIGFAETMFVLSIPALATASITLMWHPILRVILVVAAGMEAVFFTKVCMEGSLEGMDKLKGG